MKLKVKAKVSFVIRMYEIPSMPGPLGNGQQVNTTLYIHIHTL
jgi:hypothetical protein